MPPTWLDCEMSTVRAPPRAAAMAAPKPPPVAPYTTTVPGAARRAETRAQGSARSSARQRPSSPDRQRAAGMLSGLVREMGCKQMEGGRGQGAVDRGSAGKLLLSARAGIWRRRNKGPQAQATVRLCSVHCILISARAR